MCCISVIQSTASTSWVSRCSRIFLMAVLTTVNVPHFVSTIMILKVSVNLFLLVIIFDNFVIFLASWGSLCFGRVIILLFLMSWRSCWPLFICVTLLQLRIFIAFLVLILIEIKLIFDLFGLLWYFSFISFVLLDVLLNYSISSSTAPLWSKAVNIGQ